MWSHCRRTCFTALPRRWSSSKSVVNVEVPQSSSCVANEPILGYMPGSPERCELRNALEATAATVEDIPIMIGEERVRDGEPRFQPMPHDHCRKIAQYYYASEKTIRRAIDCAVVAQKQWDKTSFADRFKVWERAANLMAGPYRQKLNAATMLGQSKSAYQAEIDSAAELIDFLRFNAHFVHEHLRYQPISEAPEVTLNSMRFRGIDGFIAAISPFNFTAIGGNLATAPALMGNSVLWKPSDAAMLSNWVIYNVLLEAGLPPGVLNFVPAEGPTFGRTITSSPLLGGVNFTGSVPTFNWIWGAVADNLQNYRHYPRLIGECGGKNFHLVHQSADIDSTVACTVRSAFEYCGQKCSACSRLYVPRSLWDCICGKLVNQISALNIGDVADFDVFSGAVIDNLAFARIKSYIDTARCNPKNTILCGGTYDDKKGWFVQPTIIETTDPQDRLMTEEIFGPVLTVYVYPDDEIDSVIQLIDKSTRFALTGAVFAQDVDFQRCALKAFRYSAGNLYINDKSTGAVVGQQPFGGGRMSGTNDKAGGPYYLLRWTSPQSIKETFKPQKDVTYPYMTSKN